jgi:hypothetical protein
LAPTQGPNDNFNVKVRKHGRKITYICCTVIYEDKSVVQQFSVETMAYLNSKREILVSDISVSWYRLLALNAQAMCDRLTS